MAALRADVQSDVAALRTEIRADMAALRADVHAVSDRVARIEGAMTAGAWRPNGAPAKPDSTTGPDS